MPVSSSQINALYQKITLDVRVDGRPVRNLWGADVSMGVTQANASATVHFTSRPSFAEEKKPCEIWAGYGGQTEKIFDGELTGLVWSYAPGVVSLECQDLLGRLKLKYAGEEREYNVAKPREIIQNLVEAMGISSTRTHIEGSDWQTCTAQPLILRSGAVFMGTVEELDLIEGYKTYTDRMGVVRRMPITGSVGSGGRFTYTQGFNILRCRRSRTKVNIENYCMVLGLNYQGLQIGGEGISEAFADNPYVSDPPRFQGPTVRSDFIEDDPRALFVAKLRVAIGNRRPEKYELEVPGNPRLGPLDILTIEHDAVESGSSRVPIDQLQHTIRLKGASFRTSITTLGGTIVDTQVNLPPVAQADVKCFQEHDANGDSVIVMVADGTASYDQDSEGPLTYAWTASTDAGAVTPNTSTDALYRALITGAATELTLSLTVTDPDGGTNTLPLTIPLTQSTLYYEPLYLAWNDGVLEATTDGEATWNTFSGASGVTDTPPFAPEQGTIWVDEDGEVWATIDDLATDAVSLGTPAGAVAGVGWIHEIDTTRAWLGFADGSVYFGTIDWSVPSAAWEARTALPDAIYEIREGVGSTGSLRATAGRRYYGSEDGGYTWREIHDFGVGATASRMAAGFEQNMVAAIDAADPLFAETGTDTTTPGGLDELSALTIGWRTPGLFGADLSGNLYSSPEDFSALTLHADSTSGAPVRHMIRSGAIDGLIYLAVGSGSGDDNGLMKWMPGVFAPFFVRKRTDVILDTVGYGPLRRPVVPIEFVFATNFISGSLAGFWRYSFGQWLRKAPPSGTDGWQWQQLVISPYNTRRWLALGGSSGDVGANLEFDSGAALGASSGLSPLWLTEDAGDTWTAVSLPTTGGDVFGLVYCIGWQDQSGKWYAFGRGLDINGVGGAGYIWSGSTASNGTAARPTTPLWFSPFWCQSAHVNGDMLVAENDSPGGGTQGRLAYIPDNGTVWTSETWKTDAIRGWGQPNGQIDTDPSSRAFWEINTQPGHEGIVYWTDYRETDPASDAPPTGTLVRPNDVDGVYNCLAASQTHLFIGGNIGSAEGFERRPLASWQPTGTPDHPMHTVYYAQVDRQTRGAFVGFGRQDITTEKVFVAHDGRAWSEIAWPDASFETANGGLGALYLGRNAPYAVIGQVVLP